LGKFTAIEASVVFCAYCSAATGALFAGFGDLSVEDAISKIDIADFFFDVGVSKAGGISEQLPHGLTLKRHLVDFFFEASYCETQTFGFRARTGSITFGLAYCSVLHCCIK
jgi:hypothetical protein